MFIGMLYANFPYLDITHSWMFFASFRVRQYFWFFRQRLTSFNDYIFIVKSDKEARQCQAQSQIVAGWHSV